MYTTAARIEPTDNDTFVAMIVASLCMFLATFEVYHPLPGVPLRFGLRFLTTLRLRLDVGHRRAGA